MQESTELPPTLGPHRTCIGPTVQQLINAIQYISNVQYQQ